MKRAMIGLLSAIVAGLMLIPGSVSAGTLTMVVEDPEGDLGFGVDMKTGGIARYYEGGNPVGAAAYLDLVSTSLSLKKDIYRFGMEMAAALPEEGSPLPEGVKLVEWAMWIDPSPYNVLINPVAPLYLIALRYDGSSYSAFILDYATMLTAPIAFSVDGSALQLKFTSASIGDLAFEWWSPLVRAWWGTLGSAGYWFVDAVDLPLVDGYAYVDLPWPPE
jgi:hypothetical protein